MQEIELNGIKKDYFSDEAYKILRTNIEFSGTENKVIAITACTQGEGKSTVSLSLAVSLAQSNKKVLFIDADLRASMLAGQHRIKGAMKGLSHFLSGQAKVGDVMCHSEDPGMELIFAGVVPPNPAELLGGKRFESLLENARTVYDYIIIDTPPLGSVIDAAIVSKQCDASIMVIAANEISYKYAKIVKEQLQKSGCPILGVVLNKVDRRQNKYYGGYGKYSTDENRK